MITMNNNTTTANSLHSTKSGTIPRAAAAAMLSSSLSAFILNGVFGTDTGLFPVFSVMLLCAVFTAVIELITLPNIILLSGASLGVIAGSALLLVPFGETNIYTALANGSEISMFWTLPMVLLLCCALCLAVCVLNRSFVIRCITAGGLLTMLIIFMWFRVTLLTVPAILITAYILIAVCQICARITTSKTETPQNMWFVSFSLIAAVVIFLLPHPDTRIQWEKLFYTNSSEQLEQLGDALDIDRISDVISESGYSEDQSSLGGWIDITEKNCLLISYSDAPHSDRLVGSIYDSYTGKGWQQLTEINYNGYCTTNAVSSSALSYISGTDIVYVSHSDICGSAHIKNIYAVSESDAPHKTVFYPPYSYIIISDKTGEAAVSEGTHMTFSHSPADTYMAYYYKQPCKTPMSDAELKAYLTLPDTLPERVRDFAAQVTEGCTDNESKAYSLLHALSGYAYETLISHPPVNHDLVDYFLFDVNKGYCAYHASAMAVLARCVGIPSRYVQGYCINSEVELEAMASSGNAHAWAELYIDGCWIIYDSVTSPVADVSDINAEDSEKDSSILRKILLYAYAATAAAAGIFIILKPFFARISWHIRTRKKYGKRNDYRTVLYCGRLLWVLSACGADRADHETLSEFGKRVCAECEWLDSAEKETLSRLLNDANRVLYSAAPSKHANAPERNVIRIIRRAYIRKCGLVRYLRGHRRASLQSPSTHY